jgi:hypothetical protein
MAKRDRKQLANRVSTFVKKYGRRAHAGYDPNDRSYDRAMERLVKRMKPEDLDRLLREGDA